MEFLIEENIVKVTEPKKAKYHNFDHPIPTFE